MTIVSRSNFGGYMQQGEDENSEDTPSYTKEQLLWKIRTALAGRASEIVFYGEEQGVNTGVSSDLEQATALAVKMACRYGMLEDSLVSLDFETILGTSAGDAALEKVQDILRQEMETTLELIRQGREKVDALAKALLEKNHLLETEIAAILAV